MTGRVAWMKKGPGGSPIPFRRYRSLLSPAAGMLLPLIFVCGCLSSSPGSLTSQYPTLAEQAQMDETDFQIYLTRDQLGANGIPITIDSVKNITIGAKVSTANSTYIVRPVFDLSLLDKDNYLDVNLSSGTQAVTEIKLVSNSNASSHSGQERYDFTASGSYGGLKAAAAYHQENKRQDASSDGSVNVTMSYNNSGAYVAMLTGGFNQNASFTSYLVGSKLDDATVKSRVDYTEAYVTGQSGDKYIKNVTIVKNGQLDDQENAYGNIQLLGEMERILVF